MPSPLYAQVWTHLPFFKDLFPVLKVWLTEHRYLWLIAQNRGEIYEELADYIRCWQATTIAPLRKASQTKNVQLTDK